MRRFRGRQKNLGISWKKGVTIIPIPVPSCSVSLKFQSNQTPCGFYQWYEITHFKAAAAATTTTTRRRLLEPTVSILESEH